MVVVVIVVNCSRYIILFLFLFLFLLVNNCILIYLETKILSIYNFLILYRYLFEFFFSPLYSSSC